MRFYVLLAILCGVVALCLYLAYRLRMTTAELHDAEDDLAGGVKELMSLVEKLDKTFANFTQRTPRVVVTSGSAASLNRSTTAGRMP